jgi:hypothetical protein
MSMAAGYPIEVFWSDEDQVWIADVPDLPFCTAHGATPHEARPAAVAARRAGIAMAHLGGWPGCCRTGGWRSAA